MEKSEVKINSNENQKTEKTRQRKTNLLKINSEKLAEITDSYIKKYIPCVYSFEGIYIESWKSFFDFIDKELKRCSEEGKYRYELRGIPINWVDKNSNIIVMIIRMLKENGFVCKLKPIQYLQKDENKGEVASLAGGYKWITTSYTLEISWDGLPEVLLKIEQLVTTL